MGVVVVAEAFGEKLIKVLYLSAFLPSAAADSAGVLDAYHILRGLSKKHEVTLLAFASKQDEAQIPALRQLCSEVTTIPVPASPGSCRYLMYTVFSFLSRFPAIARMSHSRRMVRLIQEQIGRVQFDLVHVEFTQMAHYIEYLGLIPAVLDESDLAFVRRERFARTISLKAKRKLLEWDTRKLREYELGFCRKYDAVLVRTECDRQLLQSKIAGLRLEVIPPWVDLSFASSSAAQPQSHSLLFYGAMWRPVNEQAALYFINHIFPLISARIPGARFLVAGSRPSQRLKQTAGPKVEVTGYVEDIAPYYERTSIAVVPLLSGAGIKGKVIQALACGKPVVTTSVGAEGIPATEADGLFVRDDPQAFAECVLWLLERSRFLQFEAPAKSFVARYYDWGGGLRRLENLYGEIVARGTRKRFCELVHV